MRSVSPQFPLLAGELPPLAPSAYAPSPRKEGEEEEEEDEEGTVGKAPDHTQPHSNAMRGEEKRGYRGVTGPRPEKCEKKKKQQRRSGMEMK